MNIVPLSFKDPSQKIFLSLPSNDARLIEERQIQVLKLKIFDDLHLIIFKFLKKEVHLTLEQLIEMSLTTFMLIIKDPVYLLNSRCEFQ